MEIDKILKSGEATLIDVRTVEEFEEGSAPGASNIPLHLVPTSLDKFKTMKHPIVVFCRSGARSGQATAWLKQNGVEVLNGGGLVDVIRMIEN